MNNDYIKSRIAIAKLVTVYRLTRGKRGAPESLRSFADALSGGKLPITYQTIRNWELKKHFPDRRTLEILRKHKDWRGDLANDLLAVMYPDEFKPATGMVRMALEQAEKEAK